MPRIRSRYLDTLGAILLALAFSAAAVPTPLSLSVPSPMSERIAALAAGSGPYNILRFCTQYGVVRAKFHHQPPFHVL